MLIKGPPRADVVGPEPVLGRAENYLAARREYRAAQSAVQAAFPYPAKAEDESWYSSASKREAEAFSALTMSTPFSAKSAARMLECVMAGLIAGSAHEGRCSIFGPEKTMTVLQRLKYGLENIATREDRERANRAK